MDFSTLLYSHAWYNFFYRAMSTIFRTSRVQRGFTIVETVVAIAIVGVIVVLYASGINTFTLSRDATDEEIATHIANTELESLRSGGYSALATTTVFTDPLMSSLASSTGSTTVSMFNATTKEVDVMVSWMRSGKQRSITISTLMTKIGGL